MALRRKIVASISPNLSMDLLVDKFVMCSDISGFESVGLRDVDIGIDE